MKLVRNPIRISEAEANATDLATLLARPRAGAEIIIENDTRPIAIIHAASPVRRTVAECIALANAHERETNKAPVLDADFAEDVEQILSNRKPWNPARE